MEAEIAKSVAVDNLLKETPDKDDCYSYRQEHDFVANGQIMVTITLSEYRALVKANADSAINEANSRRFTVERERDELKKQVETLQKDLNNLKSMIANAVPVKVSVDARADE